MVIGIIDNSITIIERLEAIISEKNSGIQHLHANRYLQALELINHRNVHILIIDFSFKENSGFTLLQYVKHRFPQISVIIMFNDEIILNRVKCLNAGADFLFDKYYDFEDAPTLIQQISNKLEG